MRHVLPMSMLIVLPMSMRGAHPNPLPQERETAGTALENSGIVVAVPAFLSLVSEAHDNQARLYYQSTGECFSLSSGRGRGWAPRIDMGNTMSIDMGNT